MKNGECPSGGERDEGDECWRQPILDFPFSIKNAPKGRNIHNRRPAQPAEEAPPCLSRGALSVHSGKRVLRAKSREVLSSPCCVPLHLHGVMKMQALRAYSIENGELACASKDILHSPFSILHYFPPSFFRQKEQNF
ncbi:MAG: hypothetical protein LBU42_06050 [Prevotellaceae bacterium]|jgi:hypothetical protein|nr:hypothetical protein [Prevotellaceae bacterium]